MVYVPAGVPLLGGGGGFEPPPPPHEISNAPHAAINRTAERTRRKEGTMNPPRARNDPLSASANNAVERFSGTTAALVLGVVLTMRSTLAVPSLGVTE